MEDTIAGALANFINACKEANRSDDDIVKDGIRYCRMCGEPKEKYFNVGGSQRLIARTCKCEREAAAEKEKIRKRDEESARSKRFRNTSLMDAKFEKATFENFEVTKYNSVILNLCKRYANNFEKMKNKNQGLLLWGDVGTGKSFAAACIANELLNKGVSVVMTSFVKLLDICFKPEESMVYDRLMSCRLLILDDLGAQRNKEFAWEKVYNIIDSRYRTELPMIITTNLTLNQIIDEEDVMQKRVYDRILEVCYPIQFTGPSWRQKQAQERFEKMKKAMELN